MSGGRDALAPRAAHLRLAAEVLQAALTSRQPADQILQRSLRAHREMGARDRAQVAEAVYGVLRQRRLLDHLAGGENNPPGLLVSLWWLRQGLSARALAEQGAAGDLPALAMQARTLDEASLPFAVRAHLPDDLAQRLLARHGEAEALNLARALAEPAPVDVRVNRLKAGREQAQARLAEEGHEAAPTPLSPDGLRLASRRPLFATGTFRDGWIEVQDEGSQLIAHLLAPQPGQRVADLCAGGGGKTLHLGALMNNRGRLDAFDVSARRLDGLKPRLARSGLSNLRAQVIRDENDTAVKRLRGQCDAVLVDAPCSGTGTLRRNPDIRWRPLRLAELAATQTRLLAAGLALLKPGGRLVYATCSLLSEENQEVVQAVLAQQPAYELLDASAALARAGINVPGQEDPWLELLPHRHHTDGFFAALLQRT
jgi:16S rRNA (cytosine967-C5)-methyltransferase